MERYQALPAEEYQELPGTEAGDCRVAQPAAELHLNGAQGPAGRPLLESASPPMQRLLEQVRAVARVQATVLLQGESGTGKEVIARALHAQGARSQRPFVGVNCAALPEGLLESELFGHERGAFTGAARQRPGRFELAAGGTVFLDEIGAAEPRVQARLLRVLQEREFERVGGTQTLRVSARVVAATNADLAGLVAQGRFREDLFYRLNVVPLRIPPLRERREDIPALVHHFVARTVARNGCLPVVLAPGALQLLCRGPWPGNVRQLENVVERMVVLAAGGELGPQDVPSEVLDPPAAEATAEPPVSFSEARDRFEHGYLCTALRRHNGIIAQVAEAIGMSRKNLYTKLDQLQIDYRQYRL